MVRGDRHHDIVGPGFDPPTGQWVSDPDAAHPAPGLVPEDFLALLELLRAGKIRPVVAERLPITEARHAHEMLESTASKGKLVLVP